jgi:hypothetical protein
VRSWHNHALPPVLKAGRLSRRVYELDVSDFDLKPALPSVQASAGRFPAPHLHADVISRLLTVMSQSQQVIGQ